MEYRVEALTAKNPVAELRQRIARWAINSYQRVRRAVERNITGRVLHGKVGGPLFKSIGSVSRVFENGFNIGTNLIYGRAWELGFHRKAYDIFPVRARILAIPIEVAESGGYFRDIRGRFTTHVIFRPRAHIPAQTFPAKPFIKPAIDENRERIQKDLISAVRVPLRKAFNKHIIFTVRRVA
jgi:hypothetical protein